MSNAKDDPMIFHASLPADQPRVAAQVLARILGGMAMPFPPGGSESWMAWSADGLTELEVSRRGFEIIRGAREIEFHPSSHGSRASDWHVAIGTPVPGDEVLRIAAEAGWPARLCQRGNFFHCIEVWIEGAAVIEVLDPSMQAEYRASMTPANWRTSFGLESAA
jgi:hypothetical protein